MRNLEGSFASDVLCEVDYGKEGGGGGGSVGDGDGGEGGGRGRGDGGGAWGVQ